MITVVNLACRMMSAGLTVFGWALDAGCWLWDAGGFVLTVASLPVRFAIEQVWLAVTFQSWVSVFLVFVYFPFCVFLHLAEEGYSFRKRPPATDDGGRVDEGIDSGTAVGAEPHGGTDGFVGSLEPDPQPEAKA